MENGTVQIDTKRFVQKKYCIRDISNIPNRPGVYFFYHANEKQPVYIGKSITLQTRIRSHFRAARSEKKAYSITHSSRAVGIIETHSELAALLLEAKMIKVFHPVFNRQLQRIKRITTICAERNSNDYLSAHVKRIDVYNFTYNTNAYGLYNSTSHAISVLENICNEYALCRSIVGIESTTHNRACFAYQLKQCSGGCVGKLCVKVHNRTLLNALQTKKMAAWPYEKIVWIDECNHLMHAVSNWQYLYTKDKKNGNILWDFRHDAMFDKDIYYILWRYIQSKHHVL